MNFLSKAASFVGAMTLAATTFAGVHQVERCPGVDAIRSQGISVVLPIDFDLFVGMEASDYDTSESWAFLIGPLLADSDTDALEQANDALNTLSGSPLPEDDDGLIVCEYNTGNDELLAFAVYADDFITTQKVQHLFHK